MNQTHTLAQKPVMWTHEGVLGPTNPVCRYEVTDETGRTVGYITNARASGHMACWKISRVKSDGRIGESSGEYATPEEALSAFQHVKAYFAGSQDSKTDDTKVDVFFTSQINKARAWTTRQLAQNDAISFGHGRIIFQSQPCTDFRVEERAPGQFVLYCLGPFALRSDGELA